MKWYGYILLAAILLVVLFSIQSTTVEEDVFTPTAQVVGADQVKKDTTGSMLYYDMYIIGNEVLPVTYEATAGDVVVLTLVDTGDYDVIDFQVPELGIVQRLGIGDEVEITVPVEGDFDFFCMTCSPALQGNLLVHE